MSDNPTLLSGDARRDIQGFIASGYGHLTVAVYLFIRITDSVAARAWIGSLIETIATSAPWPKDASGETIKPSATVNVAFTSDGLRACGLPQSIICTFPAEFQEGIASPSRSKILGDTEESAPRSEEHTSELQSLRH